jgi:ABC-type Fe3+ transport system permease subunit
VDNPLILVVAVVVLIVMFVEAYVMRRGVETQGRWRSRKPVRLTRGAWIALAFVAVFVVIAVVVMPLLEG